MGRRGGRKAMRNNGASLAILIMLGCALLAATAHAENLAVRNCTWCHGGSASGYPPAPALAGQRPQYVEKQLAYFHARTRDNPFARQYMWGAARNIDAQSARNLALYFASLPPPMTACQTSSALGRRSTKRECRKPISSPASYAMGRTPKASGTFRAWAGWIIRI